MAKVNGKVGILFIAAGERSRASSRYRVYELKDKMDQTKFEISILAVSSKNISGSKIIDLPTFAMKILSIALTKDVIYIQKETLPIWFLRILAQFVDLLIYDFDDAIYATEPWGNSEINHSNEILNQTLDTVSVVIAGSSELADYAHQYSDNVYIQPTALPKELYENHKPSYDSSSDTISLGWIGNPENIRYLSYFESEIDAILDLYSDLELKIITAGKLPANPFIDRKDVTYVEWSIDSELDLLSEADIGIRPLTDDTWTRAKGGFTSVVQCMALSLPVVVSPVGMLNQIIDHGQNGYLAKNNDEWKAYIGNLIEDEELRIKMGQNAFETIEHKRLWTYQRANDMEEIIKTNLSKVNHPSTNA